MNEASRLLRQAIQEVATDPFTGKIDMDIINTGQGSSGRRTQHDLMDELRTKILSYKQDSMLWKSLYNDFKEQCNGVCI